MASEFPHLDKYIEMFKKHVDEIDLLQMIVLNGHLIIESILDSIVSLAFSQPDYFHEAQLEFKQKVLLARAYATREIHKDQTWNLILAVNSLRNEIAHNLIGEKRHKKMEQLRRLYLARLSTDEAKTNENEPDFVIAGVACGACAGFLGMLENDSKRLRQHIDTMLAGLLAEMKRRKEAGQ